MCYYHAVTFNPWCTCKMSDRSRLGDFQFKCIRCGSCCSGSSLIVNLTPRDMQVLARQLRCTPGQLLKYIGFYQVEVDSKQEEEAVRERLVVPPVMTSNGMAYVGLLKRPDGKCVFLENEKCSVYQARPRICQSFPFTFMPKAGGGASIMVTTFATNLCPGIGKGPNVNPSKIKDLGKITLDDIESCKVFIAKWNARPVEGQDWSPRALVEAMIDHATGRPSRPA